MAMDRKQYLETQRRLLDLAREMRELPLEDMVEAIDTAKALMPALDPRGFEAAERNLANVERLAKAGLAFKRALPDVDVVIEGAISSGSFGTVPAPRVRERGRAFPDVDARPGRRAGATSRDDDPARGDAGDEVPNPLEGHDFGSLHA